MEKNITANFNSGFDFEIILVHLEMTLNSRFLAMTDFRVQQTSPEPSSIRSQPAAFPRVIFLTKEQKGEMLLLFSF